MSATGNLLRTAAKWVRSDPWVPLVPLALGFLLFLVFYYYWPDDLSVRLERASAFLAVLDDFLVRVLAIVLLVITGVVIATNELRILWGRPPLGPQKHYVGLLKFSALLGASGVSFFAAYELDEMDDELYNWLNPSSITAPSSAQVLARWVQVVAAKDSACRFTPGTDTTSGTATALDACPYDFLVRAVVAKDATCPKVAIAFAGKDNKSVALDKRDFEPPWGLDQVRVCQKRLKGSLNPRSATFPNNQTIPITTGWNEGEGPARVVAFGDTGCRDSKKQRCLVPKEWRFTKLSKRVVASVESDAAALGLVIHLGDFMYVKHDVWSAWKLSFFDPAAPLLSAAPWIMVRGNHERCGEFGDTPQGYYLFFDTGAAKNCENDTKAGDLELTDTYAVDLSDTHRVIVADSAISFAEKARDPRKGDESNTISEAFPIIKQMLGGVGRLAQNQTGKQVWLATHVPVFALEECKKINKRTGKCGEDNPDDLYAVLLDDTKKIQRRLAGVVGHDVGGLGRRQSNRRHRNFGRRPPPVPGHQCGRRKSAPDHGWDGRRRSRSSPA